ncbi:MAG TPA: hypothetical protein PL143_16885 [Rhodocyclaceae bacterium]|nr:hypothetical protein [Rhodocyclaceae bacterium]
MITRLLWVAGTAAALLAAALVVYLAPLGTDVVTLQLAFSPPNFGHVVHGWSPEQLQRYRQHLPVAALVALCYGAFGYLLATRTGFFAGFGSVALRLARWSLPLAALCHVTMNALHGWLTAAPRFGLELLYAGSAGLALSKWLLLIGFGVLVVRALLQRGD